jgi:hypothetical protein
MKRIFKLMLALVSLGILKANAQTMSETNVKFMNSTASAVVASYNVPESVMRQALEQKLSKENIGKVKESKGYYTFSGITWNRISADKMDYYFTVDGKKNNATITVIASKGYNNFISSSTDLQSIQNIKAFLSDFAQAINAYQLSLDIKAQQDAVATAEKNYVKSTSQIEGLKKEKEALEKKIAQSDSLQAQQHIMLDAAKQKLLSLQAQSN